MTDRPEAQEAEFEAILTRLRAEVERWDTESAADAGGDEYPSRRREAEALWAVSAERPFLSRPGAWGRGLVLRPAKSVLRKLMRWYVEPLAADQRRFNAAVLRLADTLSERDESGRARLEQRFDAGFDEQRAAAAAGARRGVELEERLTQGWNAVSGTLRRQRRLPRRRYLRVGTHPGLLAFESRMRELARKTSARRAAPLRGRLPRRGRAVLDIGCGRGGSASPLLPRPQSRRSSTRIWCRFLWRGRDEDISRPTTFHRRWTSWLGVGGRPGGRCCWHTTLVGVPGAGMMTATTSSPGQLI